MERVGRIFRRHGAVNHETSALIPVVRLRSSFTLFMICFLLPSIPYAQAEIGNNSSKIAVTMLDKNGMRVQLPFDLTLPFARWVAYNKVQNFRRYTFSKVYRKNPTGGQPRELFGCEFDIVATPTSSQHNFVYIAEAIKAVCEVGEEFNEQLGAVYIKLNSYAVLDALLKEVCGETNQLERILSVLSLSMRVRGYSIIRSCSHLPRSRGITFNPNSRKFKASIRKPSNFSLKLRPLVTAMLGRLFRSLSNYFQAKKMLAMS